VTEWFYRVLTGIDAAEPGFEHIRIAPLVPDDLEWTEGAVDTIRGEVLTRWERVETSGDARDRGGLALEATIPGNATATVAIPTLGGEKLRLRESGKTVWNNGNRSRPTHESIDGVDREGDRIVIDVGSGECEFELEQIGADE